MKSLHQTIYIFVISAVIATSIAPTSALAFESRLSNATTTQFKANVRLSDRDPYLALAIDHTPKYNFNDTVGAISPLNPETKSGHWPAETTNPPASPARLVLNTAKRLEAPLTLEGEASYYSRAGCLGCVPKGIDKDGLPIFTTATGEVLNDNALTMAIGADKKHLVGHKAKVTNLVTGQSVEVRINDTGGFYQAKYGSRVADLTPATKQAIGMKGGVGQVRVEVY